MKRALALALSLALLGATAPVAAKDPRVVYTKKSLYRNILVSDEGDRMCLAFRLRSGQVNSLQSCMLKQDHDELVFDYSRSVMVGLLSTPAPKRVLVLGLGGGSIPRVYAKLYPKATIDVVEIDPAVVQVAADWFDFKPTANVRVHVKDGRQFVKQAGVFKQSWDLVVLDAFNGDYIPEHMMTREFLEECKAVLAPNGTLVANTFSRSRLYESESATYAAVFGRFINLKHDDGNRIIVGRNGAPPTLAQLKALVPNLQPRLAVFGVDFAAVLSHVRAAPDWDPKARILTDEWNPANVMKGK
jgi:spermidine synthase